jgi:hypothetical protein
LFEDVQRGSNPTPVRGGHVGFFSKLFGGPAKEKDPDVGGLPAVVFTCIHCGAGQKTGRLNPKFNMSRCPGCEATVLTFPDVTCGGCGGNVTAVKFDIRDALLQIKGVVSRYRPKNDLYSAVVICSVCKYSVEWNGVARPQEILGLKR